MDRARTAEIHYQLIGVHRRIQKIPGGQRIAGNTAGVASNFVKGDTAISGAGNRGGLVVDLALNQNQGIRNNAGIGGEIDRDSRDRHPIGGVLGVVLKS